MSGHPRGSTKYRLLRCGGGVHEGHIWPTAYAVIIYETRTDQIYTMGIIIMITYFDKCCTCRLVHIVH